MKTLFIGYAYKTLNSVEVMRIALLNTLFRVYVSGRLRPLEPFAWGLFYPS